MTAELPLVLRWTLVVVAAQVLQVGVVADLRVLGVHPDLLLLVAVTAGIAAGASRGAQVGFVSGLLVDLMLAGTLGVSALAYAVVGFVVGAVAESLMSTSRAVSIGLTAAASVVGVLLYAVVGQLLGQDTLSDPNLLGIIGIVAAFNAVGCLPALAACRWAEAREAP